MKSLKSAGLVLGLAIVATAFLAVGSAAAEATKFCKANEAKCSEKNTLGGSFTGLAASFTEKPSEASMTMPPFRQSPANSRNSTDKDLPRREGR